ncbi:MAG TPA: VOC family protein [Thermoanaerobaculia bacterium]|nr:VOC family protein [Thermoanaerobaculia bacterium]
MSDVPSLFRMILHVSDTDRAAGFYARLLGTAGRRVAPTRYYFDCGPVILALVDPTGGEEAPKTNPDYVYFSVQDLEAVHARAGEFGCLSSNEVHGESAGDIVTRPWGERSFYAYDPFGNGLCFVDERTVFRGQPRS